MSPALCAVASVMKVSAASGAFCGIARARRDGSTSLQTRSAERHRPSRGRTQTARGQAPGPGRPGTRIITRILLRSDGRRRAADEVDEAEPEIARRQPVARRDRAGGAAIGRPGKAAVRAAGRDRTVVEIVVPELELEVRREIVIDPGHERPGEARP